MSVTISGTSGVTFNDASNQTTAATGFGFKNRIINGAMVIDQRNAGASVTPASGAYTLDRYVYAASQASKVTIQQNAGSVTPPAGFKNYLGITVGASANVTIGAGDFFSIGQIIEGFNAADLAWGTASAATVTLSFWVRSSLTGTFGGALRNGGSTRCYPFSYSISAANTWEQKSITIAGDTTGTWLTTNGVGINVGFALGYGSTYGNGTAGAWVGSDLESVTGAVSVVSTNSATFYITGVQLEKGSTATSFDYRPYGTEFALCQRYCYVLRGNATSASTIGSGYWNSSTASVVVFQPKNSMRAAPTLIFSSTSDITVLQVGVSWNAVSAIALASEANSDFAQIQATSTGGTTANASNLRIASSTSAYIGLTAEL